MKEAYGDLWNYDGDAVIVITTNGAVKRNGECVMGRGCALEAKNRYPGLPAALGKAIKERGNIPFYFPTQRIMTLPVKHIWNQPADPELIRRSLMAMVEKVDKLGLEKVVMPRPGCGNGQLSWDDIRPMCEEILDDRFTVITFPPKEEQLEKPLIIAFTGHRDLTKVQEVIAEYHITMFLESHKNKNLLVLTGMAGGIDQIVAQVAIKLGIKYAACIPHPAYRDVYLEHGLYTRDEFNYYLINAHTRVYVAGSKEQALEFEADIPELAATPEKIRLGSGVAQPWDKTGRMNFVRNNYMVAKCDILATVSWLTDDELVQSSRKGGTAHCYRAGITAGKPVVLLNLPR